MQLTPDTLEQAVFDWLKTRPWHCGLIGGYADVYHSPDTELREFATWYTKMMFDVIGFANTQGPEQTSSVKQPCDCREDANGDAPLVPLVPEEDGTS